jgi:hypothetical protein
MALSAALKTSGVSLDVGRWSITNCLLAGIGASLLDLLRGLASQRVRLIVCASTTDATGFTGASHGTLDESCACRHGHGADGNASHGAGQLEQAG